MDSDTSFRFYFDFTDPISRVVDLSISAIEAQLPHPIERIGVEAYPFPTPPPAPGGRDWGDRFGDAKSEAGFENLEWAEPSLIPWTRKAHELLVIAGEHELATEVRGALFAAFFGDGSDIGRIDVLVELAVAAGMPSMETKAALDVDRAGEAVLEGRAQAESDGVRRVPTLIAPWGRLEGFHNGSALGTFLRLP